MDLLELQTRYITVCKHLDIPPLDQIVQPMQVSGADNMSENVLEMDSFVADPHCAKFL